MPSSLTNYSCGILALWLLVLVVQTQAAFSPLAYQAKSTTCSPRKSVFTYLATVGTKDPAISAIVIALNPKWPIEGTITKDSKTNITGHRWNIPISKGSQVQLELIVDDVYDTALATYGVILANGTVIYGVTTGPYPYKIEESPKYINLTATILDMSTKGTTRHPDFEMSGYTTDERNIVTDNLGADRKPIFNGCQTDPAATGNKCTSVKDATSFSQWWNYFGYKTPSVKIDYQLLFTRQSDNKTYEYLSNSFFPIDGQGWGNEDRSHNFGFCMQAHTAFAYRGGERFYFKGDDDVWVYINNKMAINLGGLHSSETAWVDLDTLHLTVGYVYPFDFFYCERHTTESNFQATTTMNLYNCDRYDECGLCTGVCNNDADGDKVVDCLDACPGDKNKVYPGDCGCFVPDVDLNGNGVADCLETCVLGQLGGY